MEDKVSLRLRLRRQRSSIDESHWRARSSMIVGQLLAYFDSHPITAVASFAPIVSRREVDVRPLDAWFRARGIRVAYPMMDAESWGFRWVTDTATLTNRAGFPQPPSSLPRVAPGELGAVLVPALAATHDGYRLGYGAGFYDRVLPVFCPPARALCVVFHDHLLSSLPVDAHDFACDGVLTEDGVLAPSRRLTESDVCAVSPPHPEPSPHTGETDRHREHGQSEDDGNGSRERKSDDEPGQG